MRATRILLAVPALAMAFAPPAAAGDLALATSFKYDALCAMGVFMGVPTYVEAYPAEHARFTALMTAEDRAAFQGLRRVIVEEGKGLPGPFLTLYFSACDAETLPGLRAVVDRPEALHEALKKTPYYSEADWKDTFEPARPLLAKAFAFLERIGFEATWRAEFEPKIRARIQELQGRLGNVSFLDLQTRLLG